MHHTNRVVRTWGLILIAAVLIVVGLVSFMSSEWELRLGPSSPITVLPPKGPSSDDVLPLHVTGVIQGLRAADIGLPLHIAAGKSRIYIVDSYATTGVIKSYDFAGNFHASLGKVAHDELSYVVSIAVDNMENILVLDVSTTLFVYSPGGELLKTVALNNGSRPELAWARAVQPVDDGGFYVLALDQVYRFDGDGRFLSVFPVAGGELQLALAPSEFYLGPSGLAMHAGSLWVSDSVNGRLLRLGSNGAFVDSVSLPIKDGIPPYPTALQIDKSGNFLVVDAARRVLIKMAASGETLVEARLGAIAELEGPDDVFSLCLTPEGLLLISDAHIGTVESWEVGSRLTRQSTLLKSSAQFLFPSAVEVVNDEVFIVSGEPRLGKELDYKIFKSDANGTLIKEFISDWEGEPLQGPVSIKYSQGYIYVLDGTRILVFDETGTPIKTIAEDITDWGGFGYADLFGIARGPEGLAIDPEGNLWVADTHRQRLVVFMPSGEYVQSIYLGGEIWPQALTFAPDGSLLILNGFEGQVIRVDSTGKTIATYGSPGSDEGQLAVVADMNRLEGPRDIAITPAGDIYIVDTYNSRIVAFTTRGVNSSGSFGGEVGQVYLPSGIVYHATSDSFYLADTYNHRIQRVKFVRGETIAP